MFIIAYGFLHGFWHFDAENIETVGHYIKINFDQLDTLFFLVGADYWTRLVETGEMLGEFI